MQDLKEYRFLLFSYQKFYPCGGMSDFDEKFKTKEDMLLYIKENNNITDYTDILDLNSFKVYVFEDYNNNDELCDHIKSQLEDTI